MTFSAVRGIWLPGVFTAACLPGLSVAAGIVVDDSAAVGQRPGLNSSANGVPVIEIAAPNAGGVSHNKFTEFNVQSPGVVFNNSSTDGVSQIGGFTMKNPNLNNGQQAKAILSEVTGGNVSAISGALEVFGKQADLLIANPNGVTLNGVTTLNVGNLSAIAGKPMEDGAGGVRFRVDPGHGRVIIGADGVDVSDLGYFDVVARGVELHGTLNAEGADVKILAGLNDYDPATRTHAVRSKKGENTPEVAISGGLLGAMHARNITLLSTESGAGVRHDGVIHAAEDIQISADGDIRLAALRSDGGDVRASSLNGNLDVVSSGHAGGVEAQSGSIRLEAGRKMQIDNALWGGRLTLAADELLVNATRLIALGLDDGRALPGISIDVGRFTLNGRLELKNDKGEVLSDHRLVTLNGELSVLKPDGSRVPESDWQGRFALSSTAVLSSDAGLRIRARERIENIGGLLRETGGDVTSITTTEWVNSGWLSSKGRVEVVAAVLRNLCQAAATSSGQLCTGLRSGGDLSLKVAELNNDAGLVGAGRLALEFTRSGKAANRGSIAGASVRITQAGDQQADLESSGELISAGDLLVALQGLSVLGDNSLSDASAARGLQAGGVARLRVAKLSIDDDLVGDSIDVQADELLNAGRAAWATTQGDIRVKTTGDLRNAQGSAMVSSRGIHLEAGGDLRNAATLVSEQGDIALHAQGDVHNTTRAVITSKAAVDVKAGGDLHNSGGAVIAAGTSLQIEAAGRVSNTDTGLLTAEERTLVRAGSGVTNSGGSHLRGGSTHVAGAQVLNDGSMISADRDLRVTGGSLINRNGAVIRGETVDVELTGEAENRDKAVILGKDRVAISVSDEVRNDQALIHAALVKIQARNIANRNFGEVLADKIVLRALERFLNTSGAVVAATGGLSDETAGEADLRVIAADIDNQADSTLVSKKLMQLSATSGSLTNTGDVLGPIIRVDVAKHVTNQTGGSILGEKEVSIGPNGSHKIAFSNEAGAEIRAGEALNVTTSAYSNRGDLASKKNATLAITHGNDLDINTQAGRIAPIANGLLTVNTHNLTITPGSDGSETRFENPGSIVINATGHVVNEGQALITGKSLTVSAAEHIRNAEDGLFWSLEDMVLKAGTYIKSEKDGWIVAGRDLVMEAADYIENYLARISSSRDLSMITGEFRNVGVKTGGGTQQGPRETNSGEIKHTDAGGGRNTYVMFKGGKLNIPGQYSSNLTVGQAVLEAGGDATIKANVKNTYSLIQAAGDVSIDGNVDNLSLVETVKIKDLIQQSSPITLYVDTSISGGRDYTFGSFYDFLNFVLDNDDKHNISGEFDFQSSNNTLPLLKMVSMPHYNALMSNILGADWRAQSFDTLSSRWKVFVANGPQVQNFYADKAAEIAVGGNFTHTGGYLRNGDGAYRTQKTVQVRVGNETIDTVAGDFDSAFNFSSIYNINGNFNFSDLRQGFNPESVLEELASEKHVFARNPNLPKLDMSFTQAPARKPGETWQTPRLVPLFETRIKYIDQSNFFGSEYFFKQVGYSSDRTVPVLGDAYFEHQYILRNIQAVTGGFFASNQQLSGDRLVQVLLENAASVLTDLGLQVGVPLSKKQWENLDKDIIWYETAEVNGQTVLAPRLYLAKATIDAMAKGAAVGAKIVAAGSVNIDATNVENANSLVQGLGGVEIKSQTDILNGSNNGVMGAIVSGEKGVVRLDAQGDIRNDGATIAGGNVSLKAGDNISHAARLGYDENGKQIVLSQGGIIGLGDKGRVALDAGKDVNLKASYIEGQDVTIKAGRDIVSDDLHVTDSYFEHSFNGNWMGHSSREEFGSSAQSAGSTIKGGKNGGTLNLQAGGDIDLTGGDYSADKGRFKAGGDLTLRAAQNYEYSEKKSVTEGLFLDASAGLAGNGASASLGPEGRDTSVKVGGEHLPGKAGDGKLNGGKIIGDELAGGFVGYRKSETKETNKSITNTNGQFNFGESLDLEADKTVDIGGADLRAAGDLSIIGADVISTKYKDVNEHTKETTTITFGVMAEGHSAIADTVNNAADHVYNAQQGQETNVGATAAQAVGDATNLLFGDLAGSSQNLTLKHEKSTERSKSSSDNINTLSAKNIKIKATKGDIKLKGVEIEATERAELDAARDITLTSAETHSQSSSDYQMHQVTGGVNQGANGFGGSVGLSAGYNGAMDKSTETSLEHSNSKINAQNVTLKSGRNTTLKGANVEANVVDLDIKGDLTVKSVQDERYMTHERGDWGAQVGASLGGGATGVLGVTGSASISVSAGYGKDWDNSKITKEQSGIIAKEKLNGNVGGDLNLTGAKIGSQTGEGSLRVEGKTIVQELHDYRDKDGGYAGVGVGIAAGNDVRSVGNALSDINVRGEVVDQVFYKADNKATIALKDFQSAGGIQGKVNTDLNNTLNVTEDRKIAGVDFGVTADVGALSGKDNDNDNDKVGGAVRPKDRESSRHTADAKRGSRQDDNSPQKPKYESRVVVQAGDDVKTRQAAANLAGKHPENTVLVERTPTGDLKPIKGDLSALGGKTKVQYVGHGEGSGDGPITTLGGVAAGQLVKEIAGLSDGLKQGESASVEISKIALVGCGTSSCGSDASSYRDQVAAGLKELGSDVPVKGYEGRIDVTPDGRKQHDLAEGGGSAPQDEDGLLGLGRSTVAPASPYAVALQPKAPERVTRKAERESRVGARDSRAARVAKAADTASPYTVASTPKAPEPVSHNAAQSREPNASRMTQATSPQATLVKPNESKPSSKVAPARDQGLVSVSEPSEGAAVTKVPSTQAPASDAGTGHLDDYVVSAKNAISLLKSEASLEAKPWQSKKLDVTVNKTMDKLDDLRAQLADFNLSGKNPKDPLLADAAIEANHILENGYVRVSKVAESEIRMNRVKGLLLPLTRPLFRKSEYENKKTQNEQKKKALIDLKTTADLAAQNHATSKLVATWSKAEADFITSLPSSILDRNGAAPGGGARSSATASADLNVSISLSPLIGGSEAVGENALFGPSASVGAGLGYAGRGAYSVSRANDGNLFVQNLTRQSLNANASSSIGLGLSLHNNSNDDSDPKTASSTDSSTDLLRHTALGVLGLRRPVALSAAIRPSAGIALENGSIGLGGTKEAAFSTIHAAPLFEGKSAGGVAVGSYSKQTGISDSFGSRKLANFSLPKLKEGFRNEQQVVDGFHKLLKNNTHESNAGLDIYLSGPLANKFAPVRAQREIESGKSIAAALMPDPLWRSKKYTNLSNQVDLTADASAELLGLGGARASIGGTRQSNLTLRVVRSAKAPHDIFDPNLTQSRTKSVEYAVRYFSQPTDAAKIYTKPIAKALGFDSVGQYFSFMERSFDRNRGDNLGPLTSQAGNDIEGLYKQFVEDVNLIDGFFNQTSQEVRKNQRERAQAAIERMNAQYGTRLPSIDARRIDRLKAANKFGYSKEYRRFQDASVAIHDGFSAAGGGLRLMALQSHGGEMTPSQNSSDQLQTLSNGLLREINRGAMPWSKSEMAHRATFVRQMINDTLENPANRSTSTVVQGRVGVYRKKPGTYHLDNSLATNSPENVNPLLSESSGVVGRGWAKQITLSESSPDASDPAQGGWARTVEVKTLNNTAPLQDLSKAKGVKENLREALLQLLTNKTEVDSSALISRGRGYPANANATVEETRFFNAYTAKFLEKERSVSAKLSGKAPLPLAPGVTVNLAPKIGLSLGQVKMEQSEFAYGNDVGAVAITATKFINDNLADFKNVSDRGGLDDQNSLLAKSRAFVEGLGPDAQNKISGALFGSDRYDHMSAVLSKFRNSGYSTSSDERSLHHVVADKNGGLTVAGAQYPWGELHNSKGEQRTKPATIQEYVNRSGFLGYSLTQYDPMLIQEAFKHWKESYPGMSFPSVKEIDGSLSKPVAGTEKTRQQWLKVASPEDRKAFYQTPEGLELVANYIKVISFLGALNDTIFQNNSLKMVFDKEAVQRVDKLFHDSK